MPGRSIVRRLLDWRDSLVLRKHRISELTWQRVVHDIPLLQRLSRNERSRLRVISSLFLHKKVLVGVDDLELDDYKRTVIAAQACVLILNLSLDYFDGWVEVIVYPGAFIVPTMQHDSSGVVHQEQHALGGEAWSRGPVILSWEDVQPAHPQHGNHGVNVVLHEFAHKLDLLNGAANGMPPLHQKMDRQRWTEDFTHAYESLLRHIEGGHRGRIDPYAVESPAEFFAVVTEFFFERPETLHRELPAVYAQLVQYYRQDPRSRCNRVTHQ